MVNAFPFPIEISSGEVGGPSAGLMFSLGLYDTRTPEDLTGRTIAGTGTIDPEGSKIDPGPDLYFKLMRHLARDLKACLASAG